MQRVVVDPPWSLPAWRAGARRALAAGIEPSELEWTDAADGLLAAGTLPEILPGAPAAPRVPRALLVLAEAALQHRDPARHAVLYRILWRVFHGEPRLLERSTDDDMHLVLDWGRAVRRDRHKMKAFVRFREVGDDGGTRYVAWFEPDHWIVDGVAPFFMRRFAGMRWSILTPYRSAHWDGSTLAFNAGAGRQDVPGDDAVEAVWRTYYASTFNPARINPRMMQQEMPQKYWRNLPEASLLPAMLQAAGGRVRAMAERVPEPARLRIPAPVRPSAPVAGTLAGLAAAAADCRACPLWAPATQVVFGQGPGDARVMVVGEQPGDEEDLSGRPFVGPAGRLFDRALAQLGLDRSAFYVTNAVKHFKFEQRGKVRLHRNPALAEQHACRPWLVRELEQVRPRVVVCLGAVAARALLGRNFGLMAGRGIWQQREDGVRVLPTVHPSWVLRQPEALRAAAFAGFVDDLRRLVDWNKANDVAGADTADAVPPG